MLSTNSLTMYHPQNTKFNTIAYDCKGARQNFGIEEKELKQRNFTYV